jgi:hypothetical protein
MGSREVTRSVPPMAFVTDGDYICGSVRVRDGKFSIFNFANFTQKY